MVGPMTIITTLITPYMVKIGWKIADALDISDIKLFQKKAVIII
jgi:hypothetical protein